jgi:hypothetical protein
LLFCHEDQITSEGYACPSFNAWDHVERLARNYNNSMFVFSKESFQKIVDPEYDVDGAENYYCMLYSKEPVIGVDKVLCHHRKREISKSRLNEYDKNGRFVLNAYLKARGISHQG